MARYDCDKLTILTAGMRPRDAADVLPQVFADFIEHPSERPKLLQPLSDHGLVAAVLFRRKMETSGSSWTPDNPRGSAVLLHRRTSER